MKAITLIIPNYNGAHLLRRNLPVVLKAAEEYPAPCGVIVVDDCSTDDSLQLLSTEFPQVVVVKHEVNRGFSAAVFSGVKRAETELLFLLNSDVELHPGCIEKLAQYFDEDDPVFSVSPLILNEDGTTNRHSWNLRFFERGSLKIHPWSIEQATLLRQSKKLPTLYCSGGSMMVTKSKFLALGGFHPIYAPFYGEDFDLGMRAWYHGWASYFEPNASVIHQSQGSIKDAFKRNNVKAIRRRNRLFVEWIHTPLPQLLMSTLPHTLFRLLGEMIMLDLVNLRGFILALRRLPAVIEVRRQIDSERTRTLTAVLETINPPGGLPYDTY